MPKTEMKNGADKREIAVQHADLVQRDIDRQCGRMNRDEQTEHDQRHHCLRGPELQLGHGIGAGNGDDHLYEKDQGADDDDR